MKIVSWNVNGLHARIGKTTIKNLLDDLLADIICLQEIKVKEDDVKHNVEGYDKIFSCSTKTRGKKKTPYRSTGTGTYCKASARPLKAQTDLDDEGRCVITTHKIKSDSDEELVIFNIYVPFKDDCKLSFLSKLKDKIKYFMSQEKKFVILVGDFNLTHRDDDRSADVPKDQSEPYRKSRIWFDQLLVPDQREKKLQPKQRDKYIQPSLEGKESDGQRKNSSEEQNESGNVERFFCDAFQLFPKQTNHYTTKDYSKRKYVMRVDYILVDERIKDYVTDFKIEEQDRKSDHRPISLTLDREISPSKSANYNNATISGQSLITDFVKPSTSAGVTSRSRLSKTAQKRKKEQNTGIELLIIKQAKMT